jgi:hypothetical protein
MRAVRSAFVLKVRSVGRNAWIAWATAIVANICLAIGGGGLLTRHAGGLYVVAGALLLMGARAMVIVWVLFVGLSKEEAQLPTN